MNLNNLRQNYTKFELIENHIPKHPKLLFQEWISLELNNPQEHFEPNAFHLATINEKNEPNLRVLLLKEFNEKGFIFFGNYESEKAKNIEYKNKGCMNFFWPSSQRQVRIKGEIYRISKQESEEYFLSRPFESQIGAYCSIQSQIISDREILEENFQKFSKKFNQKNIQKPDNWGGWILKANYFEFWQGRSNRLHDRIVYKKNSNQDGWISLRLAP